MIITNTTTTTTTTTLFKITIVSSLQLNFEKVDLEIILKLSISNDKKCQLWALVKDFKTEYDIAVIQNDGETKYDAWRLVPITCQKNYVSGADGFKSGHKINFLISKFLKFQAPHLFPTREWIYLRDTIH